MRHHLAGLNVKLEITSGRFFFFASIPTLKTQISWQPTLDRQLWSDFQPFSGTGRGQGRRRGICIQINGIVGFYKNIHCNYFQWAQMCQEPLVTWNFLLWSLRLTNLIKSYLCQEVLPRFTASFCVVNDLNNRWRRPTR